IDFHITNNTIIGPGNVAGALQGLYVSDIDGVVIEGNSISNNANSGILLQGSRKNTIVGNTIYNNNQASGSGNDTAGIYLNTASGITPDNSEITNNNIFDDQSTPT